MAQRNIELVETKIGIPTILVEHEGKMLPVHSKYNPIAEAERLIDSLADEIEKSDHLLFYGVGLGYHVKVAQERYPEKVFSVYEPIEQVSNAFIQNVKKTGVNLNDLAKNYLEPAMENIIPNIHDFSVYFAHRILLVTLPIYEKLVPQEMNEFNNYYKKILKEKISNKKIDKKFGERWVINTIMNAKHTFTTPNLLMQENNPFEGKPVILAAAGPSLSDEIENLKYIKEHGLAYIFAVGSANKALLKHDIMPDAVLSYDPQGTNWQVFEELMERNIDTIPLIFGTTVGYETVDYYPGPKAHVVISKDTLTPYLHDQEMVTVSDSTTISNVTFQILSKLNVSKIILVGQNFAYRDDQFYANGIKRYDRLTQQHTDGKLNTVEEEKSFFVEDVCGGQVRTNVTFDSMRKEMEYFLRLNPQLEVVNTTKGGAKVEGTKFTDLEELIKSFSQNDIVQDWYSSLQPPFNLQIRSKILEMERANDEFLKQVKIAQQGFEKLKEVAKFWSVEKLNQLFLKSTKAVESIHESLIYGLFIKQLLDIHTEQMYSEVSLANKLKDHKIKTVAITEIYLNHLNNVMAIYSEIYSIFNIGLFIPFRDKETMEWVGSMSGTFLYEGQWNREYFSRKEEVALKNINFYTEYVSTTEEAKIKFKMQGKRLQILGFTAGKKDIPITLRVNDEIVNCICPKNINDSFINSQVIVDYELLTKEVSNIEIILPQHESKFTFLGVRIQKGDEVYHPNEVFELEEMQNGDRIKAYYQGTYNRLGKLSFIGDEKFDFIPTYSDLKPNGAFYFIKVKDEYLVADRVVQNYITQQEVKKGLDDLLLGAEQFKAALLTGNGQENEWDSIFKDEATKKYLNLFYSNNLVSSWIDFTEGAQKDFTTMRGDFYYYSLNKSEGENLEYLYLTTWCGVSPGVGYRPILKP